jgi:hypothetical protein
MRALQKSLWTIAAIMALPAPAAAQDMCAALRGIATASQEPVPFASLAGREGELVPGYRYCRVETGTAARAGQVSCHTQLAPKSLIAEAVGAQIRVCLGAEAVSNPRARPWSPQEYLYQTADLSITVESHCDERCHVGRLASLTIERRRAGGATRPR